MTTVILGLGGNIGDVVKNFRQSIDKLPIIDLQVSRIYKSKAMLEDNTPVEWDMDYYNMAVMGEYEGSLEDFYKIVRQIECSMRNVKTEKFIPREIDIDIIFWGSSIINTNQLVIPHKGMLNRDFVLRPVCDIAPQFVHPIENKKVLDLLRISEEREDKSFCYDVMCFHE